LKGVAWEKSYFKKIALVALLLALAAASRRFEIFRMPQGGSVNLSVVFVVTAYIILDVKGSFLFAVIYSFIVFAMEPYYRGVVQFLLDYPLAQMSLIMIKLNLTRVVKRSKIAQGLVILGAFSVKLFLHTLSGVIFFKDFAPAGKNLWIWSLSYNASYTIPEALLALVAYFSITIKFRSLFALRGGDIDEE